MELRARIDELDNEVLELLEERLSLATDVADSKIEAGIELIQKNREDQLIVSRQNHTSLNPEFVEELFRLIIKESTRIQMEHIGNDD